MRNGLDAGTYDRYKHVINSGIKMPPLTLAKVDGVLYLVDGFHRYEAYKRVQKNAMDADTCENVSVARWLKLDKVEAKVVEVMRIEDAQVLAARANLKHGKPLSRAELRAAFGVLMKNKLYLDVNGNLKSTRKLAAEEMGGNVRHTTVYNWIKKDFPALAKLYKKENEKKKWEGINPVRNHDGWRKQYSLMKDQVKNLRAFLESTEDTDLFRDIAEQLAELNRLLWERAREMGLLQEGEEPCSNEQPCCSEEEGEQYSSPAALGGAKLYSEEF